jgi:Ferritin-like domain
VRATRREALAGAALLAVPAGLTTDDKKKRGEAALVAALNVEQAAVVAYEAIANSGRLPVHTTALLRTLQDHDNQHAQQLVAALDSRDMKAPIPPRRAAIPGLARVHDDASAVAFAIDLELRAVGAYNRVVRYIGDPNLLRTVAGAMGTDGQHLVALRQLLRREPVPSAFEHGR